MNDQKQLHLTLSQRLASDHIRREVMLKADGESSSINVIYEIYDTGVGELAVLDGMVQGVLFHCMKRGLPLRIHGSISDSVMHGLHEFQRAWQLWKPTVYHHIDLLPDSIVVADRPRSTKVIQAFSGGVDASFTLVSNKVLHKVRGGYDIRAALLVHGFDVAYDNVADFQKLALRARKTLDQFGVEIKTVRTNSRQLNIQSWMDSNSLQLAACLHQFSNEYGTAIIGSNEPYDALEMGNGSNPITDPMLSGDFMAVVHDGAGFSRTEKVEALCEFPRVVEQLKVCWENSVQHENCGRCEKCLRTRLNFAAAGECEPSCFPGRFETSMLRRLRAKSTLQILELKSILTYLRRRHRRYPWDSALQRQILLSRLVLLIEKVIPIQKAKAILRTLVRGRNAGRG